MKPVKERTLLLLLATVQFVHIVDFMIMMPLGPQLMRELHIGPDGFSALVAAYTISSAAVGFLAAPFLDRFDRRKLLLSFFAGFTCATLGCALARTPGTLLAARALSGACGGLSTSLIMAIVGDVVPAERRASGVGIIMTAFSAAAALGVPMGLQMAEWFRWEAPFFMMAGVAAVIWTMTWFFLPPLRGHLKGHREDARHAVRALATNTNARWALLFMGALVFGHFTILPLLTDYLVSNVGYPERFLFLPYLVGGVLTVFTGPMIGRVADTVGRFRTLAVLMAIGCVVTLMITHCGKEPGWVTVALVGAFFIFCSGRFVPGQAIMTLAVPASNRGAFMSLSGCARDLAAGLSSVLGGRLVVQSASGPLVNYEWLGWIAVAMGAVSLWLASRVRIDESAVAPAAQSTKERSRLEVLSAGIPEA